jgi:hypothetical protein
MNIEDLTPLLPFGAPPNWADLSPEQQQMILDEQIKIKQWRNRLNMTPIYKDKDDILGK